MNPQYTDFENSLKVEFLKLRPSFSPTGQEPIEEIAVNPIFKKLFIIDRTLSIQEVFEAGYLLWEACSRDVEKFFGLFELKTENGSLRLEIIEKEEPNDLPK